MAFSNNGVFTMPTGATDAFPGKVIASTDWNTVHTQIQAALTALGQGCPYVLQASAVAVPLTGGTVETVLATIPIPSGAMGLNGSLRVTLLSTATNNANNKTLRVRLGGLAGTVFFTNILTVAISARSILGIYNRNSAASQVSDSAGAAGALPTGVINTAVAQDLVITGQLANGADTTTLEAYIVEAFRRT